MNKYLFTSGTSNDLGVLTMALPIARELRNRGHQIAFCNPAKAQNRLISSAGFESLLPSMLSYYITLGEASSGIFYRSLQSHNLTRDIGSLVSYKRGLPEYSAAEIWDVDHFEYLIGMWNEMYTRLKVEALMKVIGAYQPDIIVNFWNPFACIAARASHKPLISIIQADVHPQSQGFIWWKPAPSEPHPTPIAATNAILKEYHLPPIKKMGELLIGDLTLVVGLPEMDPLPETARVTYIGPILWQKQDEKMPEWVGDLLPEQPVIWLYPGNLQYKRGSSSAFDSAVVLQACIEALGNEAVQVIFSAGYQSLPRQFLPLPKNFRYGAFVPGLTMAEQSDLLIHHGGYGSCQTGLYCGRPALIIPTDSERESNARRIAAQGAGDFILPTTDITGRKKQVSAEEVHTKVFKILSDDSFAENARRISAKIKTYGGAFEAARLVELFGQGQGR
jgi:UDP:flavonoid glycosyltransferase YjiC (YdhE family)